jgi:hypothetical protein
MERALRGGEPRTLERDSQTVLRRRRWHAADSRCLGVPSFVFQWELDFDALVPVFPLDAYDRRVVRSALPDVIEQLDPDELRAALFADLFLHATQQLGGKLLAGPGLQRNGHRVHALAEMDRARARRFLISRSQQDQLVLDGRRWRASRPGCARSAIPGRFGRRGRCALRRHAVGCRRWGRGGDSRSWHRHLRAAGDWLLGARWRDSRLGLRCSSHRRGRHLARRFWRARPEGQRATSPPGRSPGTAGPTRRVD